MTSDFNGVHFQRENDDEPTMEVSATLVKNFVRMCFEVLRALGPGVLGRDTASWSRMIRSGWTG